jgi:hypothetical protein
LTSPRRSRDECGTRATRKVGLGILTREPLPIFMRISGAYQHDPEPPGAGATAEVGGVAHEVPAMALDRAGTGQEGIATANADGSDVQMITTSPTRDFAMPASEFGGKDRPGRILLRPGSHRRTVSRRSLPSRRARVPARADRADLSAPPPKRAWIERRRPDLRLSSLGR